VTYQIHKSTQAKKAYRGSRGSTPPIFDLGTRRRRMVVFTPRPLYLPERITVPIKIGGCADPRAVLGGFEIIKPFVSTGMRNRTVQLIASSCTNYDIRAPQTTFFRISRGKRKSIRFWKASEYNNNNNNGHYYYYYYYYYLLQLGCHPLAVVILHVYKT